MEKRKWLWKRRSSERRPGGSESSGSFSERYSDKQYAPRESTNDNFTKSSEVTSEASITDAEAKETVKSLTEKLSAALANVSAKQDLVKQHAKVAEEAIDGWEKAENEVAALKQQLEVAVQQNLNLEIRVSHLDGALKECIRQMRQKQNEQEKKISDAIMEKSKEWESTKIELENQILELQKNSASTDPKSLVVLETLERENSFLKQELNSKCKELEAVTKLQLGSIKRIAKLEPECKRFQSMARKYSLVNNPKSVDVSYFCVDTFSADSQSDSNVETNESEQSCSYSWGPASVDELDTERPLSKNLMESDMMDDFLETERVVRRATELKKKLEKVEAEKLKLEIALDESRDLVKAAQSKTVEVESKLEEMQRELNANVDSMRAEIEKERKLSAELTVRCKELESKLKRTVKDYEVQPKNISSNGEVKLKQKDLTVAADKLAECQKTIASLGKQLKSLATLEDLLTDTSKLPEFSRGPSNDVICNLVPSRTSNDRTSHLRNGRCDEPQTPSSLPPSLMAANHATAAKNRNGFGNFFSRSKSMRVLNIKDISRMFN